MKKITLVLTLLLCVVVGVNAKVIKSEKTLWTGNDFETEISIASSYFSASSGKTLRVYMTPCSEGGSLAAYTKEGASTVSTLINWAWISSGTTTYDLEITEDMQTAMTANTSYFYPSSTNLITDKYSGDNVYSGLYQAETGSSCSVVGNNISLTVSTANTGMTLDVSSYGKYGHKLYVYTQSSAKLYMQIVYTDDNTAQVTESSASTTHTLEIDPTKQIKTLIIRGVEAGNIVFTGIALYRLKIDKIILIDELTLDKSSVSSTTEIWTGSHDLANWQSLAVTEAAYVTKLSGAKVGDVLRATYTSDEEGNINFCNSSYTVLSANSVTTTAVATTLDYEISTADIKDGIATAGFTMNGTNAVLTKLELISYSTSYDAVTITIGADEIATYSNGAKNVQISSSDAQAYYASATATNSITLTELTGCIPANTGVIVTGTRGTYVVPVGSEGWPSISTNYLRATGDYTANVYRSAYSEYTGGGDNETNIKTKYRYIFGKKSGVVAFYLVATDFTSSSSQPYHVLGAHKAYLETDSEISTNARVTFVFDDDDNTTNISTVKKQVTDDNVYYNLAGQRVANPGKGLYIVNGKKVVIK